MIKWQTKILIKKKQQQQKTINTYLVDSDIVRKTP